MKVCFKCQAAKPIDEFYKHPRMLDGHLNKCIDCTKADVASRLEIKRLDPDWVRAERARCREKTARRRAEGVKDKPNLEAAKIWQEKNPQKRSAHCIANNAKRSGLLVPPGRCEMCKRDLSLQMHHDDYSKPLIVQWLCSRCHGVVHRKDK